MAAFHQMGHDSKNLLANERLSQFEGAILSPVNELKGEMSSILESNRRDNFEIIFDPQLYYPTYRRGCLPHWDYFPSDFDTTDQSSITYWKTISNNIIKDIKEMCPHSSCSPAFVPKIFTNEYYELNLLIASEFRKIVSRSKVGVLLTLIVNISDLTLPDRAAEIASIVTNADFQRVYLVINSEIQPRRELDDWDGIKGVMKLIRYLTQAQIRVLVGYSSSDLILWKYAGAQDCATGKFFNLRRFTKSRFTSEEKGGGQVGYWFEESLLTYLRESDLIRVIKRNLLSQASLNNPFGTEILGSLSAREGKPWLALSWRQYLYWFADFESRFNQGHIDANLIIGNADDLWGIISSPPSRLFMEERPNDGSWVRKWRIAVSEFDQE